MKDNLDFGLKDKVAIVAGGGSNGNGIVMVELLQFYLQKLAQKLSLLI